MISSEKINNKFYKMQYKKVPKELISNWFKEKMNFSLNNEQLNDLCSQIDNQVEAINHTRCCTELCDDKGHDFDKETSVCKRCNTMHF